MTKFNYSAKMNQESCVKASGQSLPISLKHSVEICNFVRGKSVEKALKDLEQISLMKIPLAFKKFKHKVGHRKGNIAAGRYPIKAIGYILNLIKSAENNAIFKGMNSKNLTITHMCSHKASRSYHYSRHRGRLMKRTHVEIILTEKEIKVKKPKSMKQTVPKEISKDTSKDTSKITSKLSDSKPKTEPKAETKVEVKKETNAGAHIEKKAVVKSEVKKPEVKKESVKESQKPGSKPAEKKVVSQKEETKPKKKND